jgi:hypothetical protein
VFTQVVTIRLLMPLHSAQQQSKCFLVSRDRGKARHSHTQMVLKD